MKKLFFILLFFGLVGYVGYIGYLKHEKVENFKGTDIIVLIVHNQEY